jgi:hypothetical protein
MEPEVLIQSGGPNGNVDALVEDDGRVVYLYLRGPEASAIKSVWVQNRVRAPEEVDLESLKQGLPPLMPRAHCRNPAGEPALDPAKLRLVWLPEGNGVGLFDLGGMLAAIVPWSGQNGLDGYARAAVGKGPFAWELEAPAALERRFADAERFWAAWDQSPSPWERIQTAQLAAYAAAFGKDSRYFAIDGGQWPPRGLIRVDRGDGIVLATVGVALRPQPAVELATTQPEPLRRIELGILLPPATAETTVSAWISYIGGQASLPWARHTWLGPGHTIPCDVTSSRGFPAVVLGPGEALGLAARLPPFEGDPVNLLWLAPITAAEWQQAKTSGSAGLLASLSRVRGTRA